MSVPAASWSAAALAAGAGALAYAARGRSAQWLAPSVHRGPRDARAIALTFDDGPSESTPALLDLLARHNAPATFFQCGANARRLPEIAREVARRGHEIANHTEHHAALWLRSPGFIAGEVGAAQQTLAEITGIRPRLFRAPYGVRWFGLAAAQRAHGLLGVMWTAIARDWSLTGPAVFRRLRAQAVNGAIFCLHDGRKTAANPDIRSTLEGIRGLLPALQADGWTFRTVSDLLWTPN